MIPAAADEVSTGIAQLFSRQAQGYQAMAGKAAAFQEQFVQRLTAGAASYADIEGAIAALLHDLNATVGSFTRGIAAIPVVLDGLIHVIEATPPTYLLESVVYDAAEIDSPCSNLDPAGKFCTSHGFFI